MLVSDKELLVRKVGGAYIILCFCEKCGGHKPVIITHGDLLAEKRRMCKKTVQKLLNQTQK